MNIKELSSGGPEKSVLVSYIVNNILTKEVTSSRLALLWLIFADQATIKGMVRGGTNSVGWSGADKYISPSGPKYILYMTYWVGSVQLDSVMWS